MYAEAKAKAEATEAKVKEPLKPVGGKAPPANILGGCYTTLVRLTVPV